MNAQQRPAEAYDEAFLARFAAAQEIITTVRSLRTSKNLSPREALAFEASPQLPPPSSMKSSSRWQGPLCYRPQRRA